MHTSVPLLGREQELAIIDRLLGGSGRRGGAVVIRGDAGMGKSAILAEIEARADAADARILRTIGVQAETNLPFAGLHQLLRASIGGIDQLAGPQRSAIRTAFGMADDAPPDIFLIGLATLNLLADLAATTPVLVVADDVQWLDVPSLDVLTFVARRMGADRITVAVAIREGFASPILEAGLPELQLEPLDAGWAEKLLDLHAPHLEGSVRSRVLADSLGNPLPPHDGLLLLDRAKFAAAFAADVEPDMAEFMADSQLPWGANALGGSITEPAWKTRRSWYLVAGTDRMIPPPVQRFMAKRAGATVVEVEGSHAIYVSKPGPVAELIETAIAASELVPA